MTYLPFVDGLRAIAILAVVAYHALPWTMPGGFAGVDVFFVISGFLITRFIAAEMADGTFSLVQFFIRRARRLLPAALVCFAAVVILASFILLPDAYWYLGRSLLAAMLMVANLFFYKTGGYFSAPSLEKPLLHTWSLSVEDQFYLTWPLLLLVLLPRVSRNVLIAIAAVIALASLAWAEAAMVKNPEYAFFPLQARAWELLAGAIVALGGTRVTLSKHIATLVSAAGLLAIGASFVLLSSDSHFPGLGAVPAVLGTAAIIAAGLNQTTFVSQLLALRPMVFVGLISYSLYLWHWPLISLWSYALERPLNAAEAAAVVVASFGLAYVSWRYVERPFRHRHEPPHHVSISASDKRFAFAAVGSVVAMIGVAMGLKIFKGFPERYDAKVQTVLEQMVAGNPVRRWCDDHQNIFDNEDTCNFGRKKVAGESYDVALFGDSMSDHWAPLVTEFAEERNLAFRQVTNGGCVLFFGADIPARPQSKDMECDEYRDEAKDFIDANPKLKLAVISSYWEKWLGLVEDPITADYAPTAIPTAAVASMPSPKFDKALKETLEAFTKRGIKVLLIGQIPTYHTLPVRCIVASLDGASDAANCGMARGDAMAQLQRSNAALKRVAAELPGVSVSLPLEYMCQAAHCAPMAHGTLLYKNGGHVNRFGAEYLRRFVEFPSLP